MNSRIASAICVIIFIILLLSFVASVDAQGIMPFNEIRPEINVTVLLFFKELLLKNSTASSRYF